MTRCSGNATLDLTETQVRGMLDLYSLELFEQYGQIGMQKDLEAVSTSTIEGLGRLAQFFGFNKVMGQLYGVLLLSPKPLSLDELAERLDISKGSVSLNMQALERWGTVKEVWVRGDRRKYYEAETDLWKIIATVLEGRERREVELALRVIGESIAKLEQAKLEMSEEERALADLYLERIGSLHTFFRFAQQVLETVLSRDLHSLKEITRLEIKPPGP